jgi:hypothetical protein
VTRNIALIIVTAFINLAVSNFIFYRYQKKIENSFAEKLETFRANLQKSSTEHQVKFSRNYPKTLEVLETYHHKLQEFSQFFHQVHLFIIRAVRGTPLEDTEIQEKRHYFFRVFQDFTTYLTANRLYLPDEFIKEFEQMNDRAGILGMSSMSLFEQANNPIESIIDHINLCRNG